jgi:hypothetical protein
LESMWGEMPNAAIYRVNLAPLEEMTEQLRNPGMRDIAGIKPIEPTRSDPTYYRIHPVLKGLGHGVLELTEMQKDFAELCAMPQKQFELKQAEQKTPSFAEQFGAAVAKIQFENATASVPATTKEGSKPADATKVFLEVK